MKCPKCSSLVSNHQDTQCSNCRVYFNKITFDCPECKQVSKGFEISKIGTCPKCNPHSSTNNPEPVEKKQSFLSKFKQPWTWKEKTIAWITGTVFFIVLIKFLGAIGFGIMLMMPLIIKYFKIEDKKEQALTTSCPACNGLVSYGAPTCPHCGKKNPAPKPPKEVTKKHIAIALVIIGSFVLSAALDPTPSSNEQTGWAVRNSLFDGSVSQVEEFLENNLKDPQSLQVTHWGKVVKIGENYSVYVSYRAKNSFGGYDSENRSFIFDSNGNIIQTLKAN